MIEASDQLDLQITLGVLKEERNQDLIRDLAACYLRVTNSCEDNELNIRVVQALIKMATDESAFRSLAKPIFKAVHGGPLAGDDRCCKLTQFIPQIVTSIRLIWKYFEHCASSTSQPESNWHCAIDIKSAKVHEEITDIEDSGLCLHLWLKPDLGDRPMDILTVILSKENDDEIIYEIKLKKNWIVSGSPKAAEEQLINLEQRHICLVSMAILPNGSIQTYINGELKSDRRIIPTLRSLSSSKLTIGLLASYRGVTNGFFSSSNIRPTTIVEVYRSLKKGIQTSGDYQVLNNLIDCKSIHQIMTPAFEGSQR